LFFAFSWVNVVPACVLRLELSILIANFQVADRMLSHLGSPTYVSDSARQALPKSHGCEHLERKNLPTEYSSRHFAVAQNRFDACLQCRFHVLLGLLEIAPTDRDG